MKKMVVIFIFVLFFFLFTGCFNPNPAKDIPKVSLKTYSSLDFNFIGNFISQLNTSGEINNTLPGSSSNGSLSFGKVLQIFGKILNAKAEKQFMETVVNDLNKIIYKLDNMEMQMTASFNVVLSAISDASLSEAINQLNNHITVIDNGWEKYIGKYDNATGEKLTDGYLDLVSESEISTQTLSNETDYFINYISTDVENHSYQNAITAIRNMITQPLISGQFNILDKFVDSISLDNINSFGNITAAENALANYLTFYTGLMFYQMKATILMNEYENYHVNFDDVILEEGYYETFDSDNAKKNNSDLLADLKEQLTNYLNSGERLITQFNKGDLCRQYSLEDKIRNSDLYPYLDLLFEVIQNYQNTFIFRLVWSDEQASFNTDLTNEDVQFDLQNASGENLEMDNNYSKTSVFKLYSKGDAVNSFNGGIKRFVINNVPENENLTLKLTGENKTLTDEGCDKSYSIYFLQTTQFTFNDILNDNNPLKDVNSAPKSLSYTFGAFSYGPCNPDSYIFGNFSFYSNKNPVLMESICSGSTYYLQDTKKHPITFHLLLVNDDGIINSGDEVNCWCKSPNYGHNEGEGYLSAYKGEGKSHHITIHPKIEDSITFNVLKVNHTPLGNLLSDDIIRADDIFILEFNNGNSMVGDTGEKYHRLMENLNPNKDDTKNWLYEY